MGIGRVIRNIEKGVSDQELMVSLFYPAGALLLKSVMPFCCVKKIEQ
jgi:hypothetical protein